MRSGRPKPRLLLTVADRATLRAWRSLRSTPYTASLARRDREVIAKRARIVLAAAKGKTNQVVARQLGISAQTAGKWRARFVAGGVAGLLEGRRPRGGGRVGDDLRRAVESRLRRGESTRTIAAAVGASQSTVARLRRGLRRPDL